MTTRRSALVTGATSDIGISICKRLAQEGVFVHAAARNEERAKTALSNLLAENKADLVISDLSVDGASQQLIEAISNDGDLELIVNNAGGT
jgi:3-oxoacyl-[acyl-carrier protein] reductase